MIEEIVQLRRLDFVSLHWLTTISIQSPHIDLFDLATKQKNEARLSELNALRAERFELMARLA